MGMKIDGIATSEHLDSSAEQMEVKGHDISDLVEGRGVLNFEHQNTSSEDIIGHIVFAKKIYEKSDCANDREKMYWGESGKPFVYVKAELYDSEGHAGACAAAALVRYYHRRKEKVLAGFSIEGHTLERDGNVLKRSVGRRIALTLRPCNKACISGVLEDPLAAEAHKKSESSTRADSDLVQVDSIVFEDPIEEIHAALEKLNKTLTAGNYDAAPSSLTGGAALQVTDMMKNRVKAALRDWDRTRPIAEIIKAALPEVGSDYLNYFTHQAEDLSLKKGEKLPARISEKHSDNLDASEEQKALISGLYPDLNKIASGKTQVLKNDAGKLAIMVPVKRKIGSVCPARAATAYQDVAHEMGGLHGNVPVTNYVTDPAGNTSVVYERPEEPKMAFDPQAKFPEVMANATKSGVAQKLLLLDAILRHTHRHLGGIMVDAHGQPVFMDNSKAFSSDAGFDPRMSFTDQTLWSSPLTKGVTDWLAQLDPKKLVQIMARHKFDPEWIQKALMGLRLAQKAAPHGYHLSDIIGRIAQSQVPPKDGAQDESSHS